MNLANNNPELDVEDRKAVAEPHRAKAARGGDERERERCLII